MDTSPAYYHTVVAAADTYLQNRKEILQTLKTGFAKAQNRMKQQTDKKRSERTFEVGEKVYLKLNQHHMRTLSRQLVTKLSPEFFGPYATMAKVGPVVYRLQLSEGTHIHPLFHVSLLRRAIGNQVANQTIPITSRGEEPIVTPVAILDKRVIFQQGAQLTQVLVQ